MPDSQRTDTQEAEFDTIPKPWWKSAVVSLVWLIPLVALLVGGWLAYKTVSEKGPSITIAFKDGSEIELGKTKILYKAVEVGLVRAAILSHDLSHVEVTAELHPEMEPYLRETTQFWVVKPQIGLKGSQAWRPCCRGLYRNGTGRRQTPAAFHRAFPGAAGAGRYAGQTICTAGGQAGFASGQFTDLFSGCAGRGSAGQ